jgi:hypothetical protein
VDYDNDGILDLLSGSYDPGNIFLFRGAGDGKYHAAEELRDKTGQLIVHHPVEFAKYEQLKNDANADQDALIELRVASFGSWVAPVDWDSDGDLDLLIGSFGGSLFRRVNEGTRNEPVYGVESIPVEANGESLKVYAHADPVIADWNADGLWDLVVSSGDGSVGWYQNVGSPTAPRFGPRQVLVPAAAESKFLEQNLKPDESPIPGVRAQICVTDYNGDGPLDLIVGDYSDLNITRELSPAEQSEFAQLVGKQKELAAAIEKVRQEMFADGVDKSTRDSLNTQYASIAGEYMQLDELRKKYFVASARASFIWLYLRTAVDERAQGGEPAGRSRESTAVGGAGRPSARDTRNQTDDGPVSVRATMAAIPSADANRFKLSVDFIIADKWHINASTPETLSLALKLPENLRAIGQWQKPGGTPSRDDPFVRVYEGTVTCSHELESTTADALLELEVDIVYQVCNERLCLPPKTTTKSVSLSRQ